MSHVAITPQTAFRRPVSISKGVFIWGQMSHVCWVVKNRSSVEQLRGFSRSTCICKSGALEYERVVDCIRLWAWSLMIERVVVTLSWAFICTETMWYHVGTMLDSKVIECVECEIEFSGASASFSRCLGWVWRSINTFRRCHSIMTYHALSTVVE